MRKDITLNRPIFTQEVFSSTSLTVLTSLFHHFPDEGIYDLIVRRGGRVIARSNILVDGKDCQTQLNLDLAHIDPTCGEYQLSVGGILGFFVSEGIGRYTVTVTHSGEHEKRVLLNNAEAVPEGGIFAVTLVRPGTYFMGAGKEEHRSGKIQLRLPKKNDKNTKYHTEQAVTVNVDNKGRFKPKVVNIYTGQSVVFICKGPVQLQVALVDTDDDVKPPIERKSRHTWESKSPSEQRTQHQQKPDRGKRKSGTSR
jgi:hypothetical protein